MKHLKSTFRRKNLSRPLIRNPLPFHNIRGEHDRLKNLANQTKGDRSEKRRDSVGVNLRKFQTDNFFKKIQKTKPTNQMLIFTPLRSRSV